MAANIPFQELITKFFEGVRLEAEASDIPVPEGSDLAEYLRTIYLDRHERKNPDDLVLDCAQILGQITFVIYRSELPQDVGNPHIPHTPIDPPPQIPTKLEKRHLDLARELYPFYTNSKVRRRMANPLVAPVPVREDGKEIDQPCPLCP